MDIITRAYGPAAGEQWVRSQLGHQASRGQGQQRLVWVILGLVVGLPTLLLLVVGLVVVVMTLMR